MILKEIEQAMQEIASFNDYNIHNLSKEALCAIIYKSIDKIDILQLELDGNDLNDDCRDAFDLLEDKQMILYDILENVKSDIEQGFFEVLNE